MSAPAVGESKDSIVRQKAVEKMMAQERKYYDRKCKEYVQNPSVRIKETLSESEQRMQGFQEELAKLSSQSLPANQMEPSNALEVKSAANLNEQDAKTCDRKASAAPSTSTDSPASVKVIEPPKLTAEKRDKLAHIYIDDEDVDDEVAGDNATGPFASLDNLSMKPAHMAVFMQYLVNDGSTASDPAPLFFFLLTGIFQRQSVAIRELKRMARDVAQTFLVGPGKAPLHVEMKSSVIEKVWETLEDRNSTDDAIRTLFVKARFEVAQRVTSQLASFREMRAIGLATMFGEFQLLDDMSRQTELEIVQKVLTPTLNELSGGEGGNSKNEAPHSARNAALQMSILTIMEDFGITSNFLKAKKVDRMASFQTSKVKGSLFSRNKSKQRQVHMIAGHSFVAKHYNSLTFCDYCRGLLWGLGNQGYTCQMCGFNVHKTSCNSQLTYQCPGHPVDRFPTKDPPTSVQPSHSATVIEPSTSQVGASQVFSTQSELESVQSSGQVTTRRKEFESKIQISNGSEFQRSGSLRPRGSQLSLSAGARDLDDRRPAGASVQRAQSLKLSNERPARFKEKSLEDNPEIISLSSSARSSSANDISRLGDNDSGSASSDFEENQAETDPDMDVDDELSPWSSGADKKFLKALSKKEVKRQDLINELIHTEKTHVRKLKVMRYVFLRPLINSQLLQTREKAESMFPRLEDLISIHCDLLGRLKDRCSPPHDHVASIAGAVASVFDGESGEILRAAAAEWVKLRQENLTNLKQIRSKNPRFEKFIQTCESNPICHRLQLTDLTSIVMQRLTKYPLLLEGILKVTSTDNKQDSRDLPKVIELCRKALTHVNQVVKEYENQKLLQSIQGRLDTKDLERGHGSIPAYRQLDLSLKVLIHNGDLVWRLRNVKQPVNVHALLVSDLLVLLEHNEDKTRYFLRMHDDISPVLRLSETLPPRAVATDKKALYLVNMSDSGANMYELAAPTLGERKNWFSMMESTIDQAKTSSTAATSIFRTPSQTSQTRHASVSTRRSLPRYEKAEAEDGKVDRAKSLSQVHTAEFGDRLHVADDRISAALQDKAKIVSDFEAYWLTQSGMPSNTPENDIHAVLSRCIQGAETVVSLSNDLLRPGVTNSLDRQGLVPPNYQLVCASSDLRNQLSSLAGLVEQRDKLLSTMRTEISLLSGAQETTNDPGSRESPAAEDGDPASSTCASAQASEHTMEITKSSDTLDTTLEGETGNVSATSSGGNLTETSGNVRQPSNPFEIEEYTEEEELQLERAIRATPTHIPQEAGPED